MFAEDSAFSEKNQKVFIHTDKLHGMINVETDQGGNPISAMFDTENVIASKWGNLIPKYKADDVRTKYRSALELYSEGSLRSIYLQNRIEVKTAVGKLNAEFITFYESGAIKRVFPLYGQLSGYWTQNDEYELSEEANLKLFSDGKETMVRPLCLYFYPEGQLHSITVWPQSPMMVETAYGRVRTRIGVEFSADGKILSIEPEIGTKIITGFGKMYPYDSGAIGINADYNSLRFDKNGQLTECRTIHSKVTVRDASGGYTELRPESIKSTIKEETVILTPMTLQFLKKYLLVKRKNRNDMILDRRKYEIRFQNNM